MPRPNPSQFSLILIAAAALCLPLKAPAAQYTAAATEMNTLANAMEIVYLDTGWLTTLENLNDINDPNATNSFDYILDGGGALVISTITGEVNDQRVDVTNLPAFNGWQGPYVNFQSNRIDLPPVEYDLGSPLDPWGNPYRLYTPLGLVDPVAERVTLDDYGDTFDRFMIVSYGPDAVPSELDPPPRQIGGFTIQAQVISSVRISPATRRSDTYELRVRGYGFGQSGELSIDGVTLGEVDSWSETKVTATIGELPSENAQFELLTDGATAASTFEGFLLEGAETDVSDWMLY